MFKKFIYILLITLLLAPASSLAKKEKKTEEEAKEESGIGLSEEVKAEMRMELNLRNINSSNITLQEKAIGNFTSLGDKGVAALIKVLNDKGEDDKYHINVLYTLSRIGDPAAVAIPVMMKFLRHKNPDVRAIAARSLGRMGKNASSAVQAISKNLDDGSSWVRKSAVLALEQIDTKKARRTLKAYKLVEANKVKK